MDYNEIAARRRKMHKTYCFYAPFASFRGYFVGEWQAQWGIFCPPGACKQNTLAESELHQGI